MGIVSQFDSEDLKSCTEEKMEEVCVMASNHAVEETMIKEEVKDAEEKEAIVPQETEIKLEEEQESEKVESLIPSIEISQEPEPIEATDEVTEIATEVTEEQNNEEIEM